MKENKRLTSDDILLSSESKILGGLILMALVGTGIAGHGIYKDIKVETSVKDSITHFCQNASNEFHFQLPQKNEGILSIKFSQSEAKELSTLLSNEKALARIFVERLATSLVTQQIDRMQILDETFKGTFHMNRENDGNIDGVIKTYQIFKQAVSRMEKESQTKAVNASTLQTPHPTTARSARSAAQVMLHKRTKGIG